MQETMQQAIPNMFDHKPCSQQVSVQQSTKNIQLLNLFACHALEQYDFDC